MATLILEMNQRMMGYDDFQVGDPVWAKMKGYPPWPAKIENPPSNPKSPKNKKAHYVFFFGSKNYAWILDDHISPHSESLLNSLNKKRNASYQNAVDNLVTYLKSYKRDKPSSVKGKKKIENNNKKSPEKRIVKINKSASKHVRQVSTGKSSHKKILKKRHSVDINGEYSTDSTPKYIKLDDHYHESTSSSPSPSPYSNAVEHREMKNVEPGPEMFGFIGLGMMGKHIVKALLETGHRVTVWNKTSTQCDEFVEMGAEKARSPADLIVKCDVTFCCVSDPKASKAVLFGEQGVLKGLDDASRLGLEERGYVEMTTIDPDTSLEISEAITMKRGRFLDAPLCGSSRDAEKGALLILASGDRELFEKCRSCFHAVGRNAYFISCEYGDGAKMSLILSMLSGTVCAALAEAMVLVDRLKLQKDQFLMCLEQGPLNCKNIIEKANMMSTLHFTQVTALKHVQKDIDLSLSMGNECSQHMPITAAANEVYKHGKLSKYSNEDMSAVYKVAKY